MLLPMLTLQVLAKKVRNYHFAADRLRMVAASASLKDSAEFQGRDLKRICMETLLSPELGLCDATVEVMRVWLSLYKASTEMQVGRSVGRSAGPAVVSLATLDSSCCANRVFIRAALNRHQLCAGLARDLLCAADRVRCAAHAGVMPSRTHREIPRARDAQPRCAYT